MELTNDPRQAEVVIIYLLNIGRALLVDKRRLGATGPLVAVFPQQELLLEGAAIQAPLTPQIVHLIERRRVMPTDPRIMQTYFRQLLETVAFRLHILRPAFPTLQQLSLGPHFAPTVLLAQSDLWRMLLDEFRQQGEREAIAQLRAKLRELYADEVLYAERLDPLEFALLQDDLRSENTYRRLELGASDQ